MARAFIIFDSRFGNTMKVAQSLELGLKETGVETACVNSLDVELSSLNSSDLICVGAPTEKFSASLHIKEFLRKLKPMGLEGKYFFAFDTKVPPGIFGSASKHIGNELKKKGLREITSRESAIVSTKSHNGAIIEATLKSGEEKKFQEIGRRLGKLLADQVIGSTIDI